MGLKSMWDKFMNKKYDFYGHSISLWFIVLVLIVIAVAYAVYVLCPKGKLDGSMFEFLCKKKKMPKYTQIDIISPEPIRLPILPQ